MRCEGGAIGLLGVNNYTKLGLHGSQKLRWKKSQSTAEDLERALIDVEYDAVKANAARRKILCDLVI